MRKIGLVGGTGPESTVMYYKNLNTEIDARTGGEAMPDIAIESVDFRRAWKYVSSGEYDLLADYLAEKVDALVAGGAEVVALTAVTMHVVFDELQKRSKLPLVSIPQAVRDEILARGCRKVGLLETIFTMEKDYMKKDLLEAGIKVFVPGEAERQLVAKRIYEELEQGIVKESTLAELRAIIERMREDDGIEGVILGCTELPLILNSENCPVQCFDSVAIHLKKLVELAMN
ncbi:MAG: amino acid racemase [Clostridiales bacterium]|nr:amino acid racemase [Clostridiales bacterium]